MRVLITGATGFVGRWTVAACLEREHEVGALVLPDDPVTLSEEVALFRGTLEQPPWEAIDAFAPDVCIHSAWVTTPGKYMTSPLNVSFEAWTRSFLVHIMKRSVQRVVGVGSCLEYAMSEEADQARAPYVQCKKRVRTFLESEAEAHGVEWVWARIFFPFGEGEPPGKLLRSIVETLLRGERFPVYCPDAVRDYIAVQDVGWALAMLTDSPTSGDMDVGSGRPITVKELALCIAEVLGMNPMDVFEWGNRSDSLQLPTANPERISEAGWAPRISIHEGIRRLIRSLE
ncbi:MAG: NAD(P)-dependent oxidoreductase [Kiritimatiellia bacterium]|jgi:nucleoside-diphosphate-sugar epimerase|nr:NAD(P)-dependent oxidoreductase [Kiritimatiellia bacterium]